MVNKSSKPKTNQTHDRVQGLLLHSDIEISEKNHVDRQDVLAGLNKREGYSNTRAINKINRLRKQFIRKNKMSDLRTRQNLKHPKSG